MATMTGDDQRNDEAARRLRRRNLALLAVLMGLVFLFYVMTIVRMGGGA